MLHLHRIHRLCNRLQVEYMMQQAGKQQQQTAQQQKDFLCSGVLSASGVFMAPPLLTLSKMPKRSRSERQSPQQAPTRSHSWPRDDKRAATVVRRRFRIRGVQAWELERCACLAPWPVVLPIFTSFERRYCEHEHRCSECLRPAKNQTPTADELQGTKRHMYDCKRERARLCAY